MCGLASTPSVHHINNLTQVKVRGFRVEIQEVRNVLLAGSHLSRAEVLLQGDQLVAYVTPEVTQVRNQPLK